VASRGGSADDRVRAALEALPAGTSADARVTRSEWTTIRFANGRIHQPMHERTAHLSFRVAEASRLGTATTVDLSAAGIAAVVREARALARVAPVEKSFLGFPTDGRPKPASVPYSASTVRTSPEAATRIAETILAAAASGAPGGRTAGVVNVGGESLHVLNSTGLDRSTATSAAHTNVLVDRPERDPPVSGWSEGAHWDVRRLAAERVGREAAERVAASTPEAVAPGRYRVLLRAPAVSELVSYLAFLGFGGHGEVEGWSCLRRQRGKRVAPSEVDLRDDARSPLTFPTAIDAEGVATRATPLIERGIARPVVTDVLTAGRLGRALSGHALSPEAPSGDWGPIPSHLLLARGDAREEELIRETRRGILVTRFHYVRVVDPGRSIITGMTRDGTYRIEHGEIVGPARNLRFTQSVLETIRDTELLGRELRFTGSERGGAAATVPDLVSRSFRFTSATLF